MHCFFFRRINDLDQIAPIIYAYSLIKKNSHVNYICTNNNFDFLDNKIIKFLKKRNIKIGYLHNFCANSFVAFILDFFFKLFFLLKRKKISFLIIYLVNFLYKIFITEKKIQYFINKEKISYLVFDFPVKKSNYINFFINKKNNVKLIGIEHGVLTFKNLNYLKNFKPRKYLKNNEFFDKILVPNYLSFKRLKSLGFKKNIIKIAGCLRFSYKWNNILRKKIFKKKLNKNLKKINIVLMDHSDQFGVTKKDYEYLINFISNLKNVNFKIKPNTASFDYGSVSSNNIDKNLISKDHSVTLINWADIVICLSSSIIFDALINKKIFFYPKFLHKNTMIWENNNGCFQFNSINSFKEMLLNLDHCKVKELKKKQNTNNLLNNNIFKYKKDLNLKQYVKKNLF